MGKCKDCKWWGIARKNSVMRFCGFFGDTRGQEYINTDWNDAESEIVTSPEFGCIFFEEKAKRGDFEQR